MEFPVSEITVTRCYMDHAFGLCYPNTTPEEVSLIVRSNIVI
jgi:hypothetical protein